MPMASLGSALIQVRADTSTFTRQLARGIRQGANDGFRDLNVDPLTNRIAEAGRDAGRRFGRLFNASARSAVRDFGASGARSAFDIGKLLGGGLIKGLGALVNPKMLAGVFGIVPAIVAIGEAATGALASVAALPTLITGFIALSASLKLAFKGVGDAVSLAFSDNVDAAALAEAMKNLTPAARSFVGEIQKAKPVVDALQDSLQEAFFKNFSGAVTGLTKSLLPALRNELETLVAAVAVAGKGAAGVLSKPGNVANIEAGIQGFSLGLGEILATVPGLTQAFATLVGAAGPFVSQILGAASDGLSQFVGLIEKANADGSLTELFSTGLKILGDIGGLLLQIGGIVASVFTSIDAGGISIFGGLGEVLTAISPLLKEIIGIVGGALGSAFQALLPAVLAIANALGVAIRPVLPVIAALFAKLSPVLVTLGAAVAQIAATLGPVLGEVLLEVAMILSESLDALLPSILELLPALAQIVVDLLPELVPLIRLLAQVFVALLPIAGEILLVFTQVVIIVAKVAAQIVRLVLAFANMAVIEPLIDLFKRLRAQLEPGLDLFDQLHDALAEFADFITFETFTASVIMAVEAVVSFARRVREEVFQLVALFIDNFVGTLSQLGALIAGALASIPGLISGFFQAAWNQAVDFTVDGISRIATFMQSLPGRVAALGPALFSAAVGLGRRIGEGLSNIGDFASDIGRRIVVAVKSGINAVISSINRGIADLDNAIPGISLPRLPHFERGGIITEPTLGILGEKGKREVVLPLTDPRRTQQLAEDSGLLGILKGTGSAVPNVFVTAILGTGELMTILDQRVELGSQATARELAFGVRT